MTAACWRFITIILTMRRVASGRAILSFKYSFALAMLELSCAKERLASTVEAMLSFLAVRHARVAIAYSHRRTEERPSNRAIARQARR